ncbi:MAG: hypothetical protein ABIK28_20905 [Planctomycetota bacterium]
MRKLLSSFWLFLLLSSLSWELAAQQVYTYSERIPNIECSKAVYGSKITIRIREAPPESIVWFTMSLLEEGAESIADLSEPDLNTLNSSHPFWHEAAVVDPQGRAFFDIPLGDRPDWMGKTVLFKAYIKDNSLEGSSYLLPLIFTVDNPELCIPSAVPGMGGRISKFDELAGDLTTEISNLGGSPEKLVFTKDFRLGFAMLDQDRIAIFNNPENKLISTQQTGMGLTDIAVTPDGSKLIAVTCGVKASSLDPNVSCDLWIYDVETIQDPRRYSNPIRCPLAPIDAVGKGNLLAVGEDSTLLSIRQGGMTMGCYNLISNQYRVFEVGSMRHFRSEIKDLKVIGNRLLLLVTLSDGSSELLVINLQIYDLHRSFPVGNGVERIVLLQPRGFQPLVVLLDAADDRSDYLRLIDIYSDNEPLLIPLPDGIVDYDVTDTCGLCMILVHEGNQRGADDEWKGLLRFVDLYRLRLLPQMISVDLDSNARVYLSRADCSQKGYVYSEHGVLMQIDLKTFQIVGQTRFPGACTGPVIEIY